MEPTIEVRNVRRPQGPEEREFQGILRRYELREQAEGRIRSLGALYLAIGTFTSGLMRDQISAVILGIMACFLIFILGVPGVSATIDGWVPGLGSLLQHYLGLSGGGIAAHTLHAGMIMGALDQSGTDLNGTLGNIDSIASTSGGSWFLSQLAYSPKFQQEISRPGAEAGRAVSPCPSP